MVCADRVRMNQDGRMATFEVILAFPVRNRARARRNPETFFDGRSIFWGVT